MVVVLTRVLGVHILLVIIIGDIGAPKAREIGEMNEDDGDGDGDGDAPMPSMVMHLGTPTNQSINYNARR